MWGETVKWEWMEREKREGWDRGEGEGEEWGESESVVLEKGVWEGRDRKWGVRGEGESGVWEG